LEREKEEATKIVAERQKEIQEKANTVCKEL
jgi:hypothetical protein